MGTISYFDVFAIDPARSEPEEIRAGDLVSTGLNLYPQWRVIAVDGAKACLSDVQTQADGVVDLIRCRKAAA